MSYGTSSYGSTSIGGATASQWYVFFSWTTRDAGTVFESRLEYGQSGFFSVFFRQSNYAAIEQGGVPGVAYRVYTSNDPDETPQQQALQEGDGQTVVGAARFITVTMYIDPDIWVGMQCEVRGRAGD